MLARLAENLFWTGRYTERAEDTARIVDITYHSLLESPPDEVEDAWSRLLDVLGLAASYQAEHDSIDPTAVLRFLVVDEDAPGSVMTSMTRARSNLRSVRELVSTELWEVSNRLYLELLQRDLDADLAQPYDLFALVKRGCQTISGVATETMPRDDGWRFLVVGRLLERAAMTCRLLDVHFSTLTREAGAGRFHAFVAVLKSASGFEAFRKSYRSSLEPRDVAEFLLLSPVFPRSVLFCLLGAEQQLERLGPGISRGRARRVLGRVRSDLEYRNVDELLDEGLHVALGRLTAGIGAVADAVADEYFRGSPEGALHSVVTS